METTANPNIATIKCLLVTMFTADLVDGCDFGMLMDTLPFE